MSSSAGVKYNYREIGIPSVPLKEGNTLACVDPIVGGRIFIPPDKNWYSGCAEMSAVSDR